MAIAELSSMSSTEPVSQDPIDPIRASSSSSFSHIFQAITNTRPLRN